MRGDMVTYSAYKCKLAIISSLKLIIRILMKNYNYLLIPIICFLINISCVTDNKTKLSDIEKLDLKGNIKSIKSIQYLANEKFGEIVKEKVTWDKYANYNILFNKAGNQIEYSEYSYDNLEAKTIFKYDEKGNITEQNEYSSNGNLQEKLKLKTDDEGNPIMCDIYKSDGKLKNKIIWVRIKKKIKEYQKSDSIGKLVSKFINTYDKDNLIESIEYGLEGRLEKKYFFKYDSNGNQIEIQVLNSDENLIKLETSVFDKNNNLVENNIYDSNGTLKNKHSYKYDIQNNLIEHTNNDIDVGTFTYKYNEKEDLYEQVNFNLKKEKTYDLKRTYKYDSFGNWTEMIEFNGIIPKTITEREIVYY